MIAVFDTNIVIDGLNGLIDSDTEYSRYERVLISRITWMEVLVGVKGDDAQVRDYLETMFEVIPVDQHVSELAVSIRRTHKIRLPDAIIWASAQSRSVDLVTRNTHDYRREWGGIRVPYHV